MAFAFEMGSFIFNVSQPEFVQEKNITSFEAQCPSITQRQCKETFGKGEFK